jgi:hypothetical protein
MAGSVAARSVVTVLANNALQLATFLRRCCSNALDIATLLRWQTSQRVAAMSDSALDLTACYYNVRQRVGPRSVLLRCSATRWASERCYDVRQRFFFFFFFTRQLEERERMGERKKF